MHVRSRVFKTQILTLKCSSFLYGRQQGEDGRGSWESIKKEVTAWSAWQQCESLPPPSSYRTVFLRLASLVFLLVSLWNQITCGGNMEAEGCKACGYNYRELPVRMLWGHVGHSCAYR